MDMVGEEHINKSIYFCKIMRSIIYFISFVTCFSLSSCILNTDSENCGVHKVSFEMLYYYEDEHEDSLVCGLAVINKEIHRLDNGRSELYLHMGIDDQDYAGILHRQDIHLDEEEIVLLHAFLDSCIMKELSSSEYWEVKIKSGAGFSYSHTDKYVVFDGNQGFLIVLKITPQRLKEVLTKVMEDENLRDEGRSGAWNIGGI